jgi:6,7-dimethyl-8-ribityllumazine synthase
VAALIRRGGYHGIVALGCVIRGETPHFDFVAGEAARGLQELAMANRVGLGFGVLTTDTTEQAVARAGGERGNKGWEAALTALEMADLLARLEADARPE